MTEFKGNKKLLRKEGFSEKAIDYFEKGKNMGEIEKPDATGEFTGSCGDTIITYLKMNEETIKDATFLCTGCAGARISGAALTELVKGKRIKETEELSLNDIIEHLKDGKRGLPGHKYDCAEIALGSLRNAIKKTQALKLCQILF